MSSDGLNAFLKTVKLKMRRKTMKQLIKNAFNRNCNTKKKWTKPVKMMKKESKMPEKSMSNNKKGRKKNSNKPELELKQK